MLYARCHMCLVPRGADMDLSRATEEDLSRATKEELKAELDGMQEYLDALNSGSFLGNPLDGREEPKKAELVRRIAMFRSELDKRVKPE